MPPFLGQGLCCGMRDVSNLAWKLAMVIQGTANRRLLETYTQERKPHMRTVVDITVELGKIIGETDPVKAAARDARLRAELNSGRVETVRQNLIPNLDGDLFYRNGKGAGAGSLAVQPKVQGPSGAVLLDEIVGDNFTILSRRPLPANCLDRGLAEDWRRRGGQVATIGPEGELKEEGCLFADWMDSLQAEVVIVRPDRHVYGVARSIDEIDPIVRSLVSGLDRG